MAEIDRAPTRMRGLLLVGAVFVLGMICGAALFFTGQRSIGLPGPAGPPPEHPLDRLSRELDLDGAQREAIRSILGDQRSRLDALLEEFRASIREVLRPDQRERFDRMRPPRPEPPPPPGFGPPPPPGHEPPPGLGPPPPRSRP